MYEFYFYIFVTLSVLVICVRHFNTLYLTLCLSCWQYNEMSDCNTDYSDNALDKQLRKPSSRSLIAANYFPVAEWKSIKDIKYAII